MASLTQSTDRIFGCGGLMKHMQNLDDEDQGPSGIDDDNKHEISFCIFLSSIAAGPYVSPHGRL